MPKRGERRDPIAEYIEWTEHRYDPGHYLGGNLPPDLRKSSLSPKGRRYSGIILIVSGARTKVPQCTLARRHFEHRTLAP